ncbi:MAG: UDP-glucose 4-epimerase GalE [Chlamydiae bacterium]|nr:UDP-glucose 4-epimerase GalE [Chlamydiota bacterium]
MHVLVTGGAGYIGSHTCKALKKEGFKPVTFDNLSEGHEYAVKWGDLVKGDLLNKENLDFAFNKYQPKAVIHFAANALVSESMKNPQKYYQNNVSGTLNLLSAMNEYGVKNLIFSSSCATYGHPNYTPICEKHPQVPISPYGRSKLMIEQILLDFQKAYQMNFVSLRYFNAAGADLESEIGEHHKTETHLIPLAIDTALNIYDVLHVYGFDFDTKDGSAIRDYIHVNDLAAAHVKALNYILKIPESIFLNLGSEKGYSVLEIVKTIETLCKTKVKTNIGAKREGDPAVLFAKTNLAKKLLSWEPKHSDIKTIITTAWQWHLKKQKI